MKNKEIILTIIIVILLLWILLNSTKEGMKNTTRKYKKKGEKIVKSAAKGVTQNMKNIQRSWHNQLLLKAKILKEDENFGNIISHNLLLGRRMICNYFKFLLSI